MKLTVVLEPSEEGEVTPYTFPVLLAVLVKVTAKRKRYSKRGYQTLFLACGMWEMRWTTVFSYLRHTNGELNASTSTHFHAPNNDRTQSRMIAVPKSQESYL
ncbi:hypothetical protein [Nitrosococcus wardiae]|uniref:hypothetical protein n=1 Tax=Nitrosococcus wardiae TaxID=1814290 RepID=UPI0019825C9B|nr:hypothetical protein [Nitrosococcus wardiae]